jgi:hypothetical protein
MDRTEYTKPKSHHHHIAPCYKKQHSVRKNRLRGGRNKKGLREWGREREEKGN